MSSRKYFRWLDYIESEIGAFYDAPEITKSHNRHIKYTLSYRGEKRTVTVSSSPSKRSNAERLTIQDFNRALRDLGINERIVTSVPCRAMGG